MDEIYEMLRDETEKETQSQEELEKKKAQYLTEIGEAVSVGFMVQDKVFPENVLIVTNDMKDGDFLPCPKEDLAELFAENDEMYTEWKSEFENYKRKRAEILKEVTNPFGMRFSRYRKKAGDANGNK